MTIKCDNCPLRALPMFDDVTKEELAFLQRFKTGELVAEPKSEILAEGASSAQLYTVLSGMGVRYKSVPDGDRQVVGFVLPGDFVGLQSGVMGEMQHTVESTTLMTLCVFNRSELWSLFKSQPARAFDLTHLAATEEHLLGEALTAVGQLEAIGKIAWLLHRFFARLTALRLARNDGVPLPYRQQDFADALGLSLVHTNKTLGKLRDDGVADWTDGRLIVPKPAELARLAQIGPDTKPLPRPLI
ncbi:Crp/Fnr family transcriptional regulator [Marivita sp. S6314]|uniref:Crp/Fnr family transcriptional regulator n=1 Tax=Marivita sp. S6314 TaxID=2926406 RepID=UPI001FF51D77|nr:Crp/Fnr family transcriptional regulator [Marivita sp. S6314]MCK0149512.1 Crp/Fnr family transcriptional regulator [Marivita sp. S6314]